MNPEILFASGMSVSFFFPLLFFYKFAIVVVEVSYPVYIGNYFRKLEDGDIVNVDVTVYYKGVHGEKLFTR